MTLYLWIAFGSALGGVARFWCSGVLARLFGEAFPWGTLFVNVSGSLLIGIVAALADPNGKLFLGETARVALMAGFLGGYTTFSAFSLQTLTLMQDGQWGPAFANIALSILICLAAVWAGFTLGAYLRAV
jgi:fluoride exporter